MSARASLLATLLLAGVTLASCSNSPSRVRIQIKLAPDAQAMSAGPALLDLYNGKGRIFQNQTLSGKLPGDVVVLVNDDVTDVRAFVRVVTNAAGTAAGTGAVTITRGKEVTLAITLSTAPLADTDMDGVPDVIDDCPGTYDPTQQFGCAGADMAMPFGDDGGVDADLAMPGDLSNNPCGNGTIDSGEACDDGASNSDDPTKTATCTTRCKKRAPCGSVVGSAASNVDPATGHCYIAWATPTSWAGAERDCLARNGHLASITSQAESDRVKSLNFATPSWIGVVSAPPAGNIVWSNGETNAFTAFAVGGQGMGAASCVVAQTGAAGWTDRDCSFPTSGLLPASPIVNAAYVCESSCGNGVVEPGEDCDPPTATTCTSVCRTPRACTETGGKVSPATGACYFATAALVTYANALTGTCPAGTHLATPNSVLETETAIAAISTDSWIAVVAPMTAGVFNFDAVAPSFAPARYHGFLTPDPDSPTPPVSAAISKNGGQANAWRDRAQATTYPALCERD